MVWCYAGACAACASPDPRPDLDAASVSAQARLGTELNWAQTWAAPAPRPLPNTPLSADDAVALALHNHPEIQRALAELAASKAAWAQAGRLPNPMLDVMVGIPVDGRGGDPWTASLLQPIAWLWTRGPRMERAASTLRARALALCALAVDTAAQARSAHARVVFAHRAGAQARALRAAAHDGRELLAQRFAVGEATELERDRAALAALAADDRLAQAELEVRRAELDLVAACGVANAAPAQTRDQVPALPNLTFTDADVLAMARERFDVQAAIGQAEAAAAGTVLAGRERWPQVSAGARFERMEDGREVVFPTLTLPLPLFDRGSATVREAEANARAALSAAEATWQRAVTELRIDLAAARTARTAALRAREQSLPLARSIAAVAETSLAAGVLDPVEALAARLAAHEAELAAHAAELQAVTAVLEFERDAGVRLRPTEGVIEDKQ